MLKPQSFSFRGGDPWVRSPHDLEYAQDDSAPVVPGGGMPPDVPPTPMPGQPPIVDRSGAPQGGDPRTMPPQQNGPMAGGLPQGGGQMPGQFQVPPGMRSVQYASWQTPPQRVPWLSQAQFGSSLFGLGGLSPLGFQLSPQQSRQAQSNQTPWRTNLGQMSGFIRG
jgi:hypothetical protein